MSEQTEWYRNLEAKVEMRKAQLGADARDFYFERFLKAALRVDEFSSGCQQCHEYKSRMDNMQKGLDTNTPQSSKEQRRNFLGNTEAILSHLKKTHGLISSGQNIGIWLAIGTGMGVAIGAVFQSPAIGIPIGVSLGLVIGSILDANARKAGKVI